ncbi:MAG: hypothetical protein JRF33_17755 [Deltaproteobacteria bacterium]|nr:hypothetical protein [Deltaproteobacteria bacterium]
MSKRINLFLILNLLMVLAANGCDGDSNPSDGGADGLSDAGDAGWYPDPGFIFEAKGQLDSVVDESFQMEKPRLYRTSEDLPDTDIRRINEFDGQVLAASASGLLLLNSAQDRFERLTLPDTDEAIIDMAERMTSAGQVVLLTPTRLILLDLDGSDHQIVAHAGNAICVTTDGDQIYLGTEEGPLHLEAGSLVVVADAPAVPVRDLLLDPSGSLWLATAQGLWQLDDGNWQQLTAANGDLLDDEVMSLGWSQSPEGLLAGSANGLSFLVGQSRRLLPAGLDGLPRGQISAVASDGDQTFVAHDVGASRFVLGATGPESVNHYHSFRWIPAEEVRDVDMVADARLWIATAAGITRITFEPRTLAARAELFEDMIDAFWRLDFLSCEGFLADPWQPDEALWHRDHDNDGLWTQMQVGAWCYAAGATGDQAYCEKARRTMGAMMRLIDIPAISFEAAGYPRGFVCRSYVRDDEGDIWDNKLTQDNWHLVENWEDGHDYYWKDDTSSDETTGHFFGYPLYYDFCATEAEKEVLAEHIGVLGRHIVDNGFRLVDLDGERTLHGHWDPDTLPIALDGVGPCSVDFPLEECLSAAYGGGWLNGIEILGHMLAAYHMTGDPFFYDAYLTLLEEHRYGELVDFHDEIYTVTSPAIANHSDHELVMLGYHTLIRYEPDDVRRQRWIDSLLAMYEYEKLERNPCWSAFIAGIVTEGYELEAAIQTMREWPEDWREWRQDNSHRMDVSRAANDRHDDEQFKTVLPYDEIRTMKWNGNPYIVAGGGDGREVMAPWPWLLPYWMYRYHGIIQ